MIGNNLWIWLVVGIIPHYIEKQQMRNGWIMHIRALFWSLEIRYQHGQNRWTLSIPLVERLRSAVWAAIMHLRGDDPPRE
jgi:hypothetical protein